jgi:hypothetical protein
VTRQNQTSTGHPVMSVPSKLPASTDKTGHTPIGVSGCPYGYAIEFLTETTWDSFVVRRIGTVAWVLPTAAGIGGGTDRDIFPSAKLFESRIA